MNKTQQKFRQQRDRDARLARYKKAKEAKTQSPPVVGQVHNPALHQATKPLAPEVAAAVSAALRTAPSLVFVIQHDAKADLVHCYRFNSTAALHGQPWPNGENGKAEELVVGEFAKMRRPQMPQRLVQQDHSNSGW